MKIHQRAGVVAGAVTALVVGIAPTASAHGGVDHDVTEGPGRGNPTAGVDFFADHLGLYHFGRQILGFDRALTDPYDWAAYHLVPVNLELAARSLSPTDASEAKGDTWVETPAREVGDSAGQGAGQGSGHGGPPSHAGYPLRLPVSPAAGLEYLNPVTSPRPPWNTFRGGRGRWNDLAS